MTYPEAMPAAPAAPDGAGDPPSSIRRGGALTALEGSVAVVIAAALVIRELQGGHSDVASGYGTALWFLIIGGGVLAGGVALVRGRRWGRAPAVLAQVLLVPVAWSLLTDSRQPALGALLGLVVVAVLVLLFLGPSIRWMNHQYELAAPPPAPQLSSRAVRSRRGKPRQRR